MNRAKIAKESRDALSQSGTSYQTPDISAEDYVPDKPFKGIYVNDVAGGDLTIHGVDGSVATFTVAQGLYPFGGIAILASSTVTDLVAIF